MGESASTSSVETNVRCRFCGGESALALQARDRLRPESPLRYGYFECRSCRALQLEPETAGEDTAYRADYYTRISRTGRDPRRAVGARPGGLFGWRRARVRRLLSLPEGVVARAISGRRYGRLAWFRRTGIGPDDPILDVGCGSGRLLWRLHREGFVALVGIDPLWPFEPGPEEPEPGALGADAIAVSLRASPPMPRFERATAETHAGEYALVMAHHSFEHARDPQATFAALAARVRPGGWLLLRTPLADGWARAHYGAEWAQLDAPRHRNIPTRRALETLARAQDLALRHVEDDSGVFQIWGSERALPRFRPARLLRWLAARRAAARLRRAGRGDQAAFYLQKPRSGEPEHGPRAPAAPAS